MICSATPRSVGAVRDPRHRAALFQCLEGFAPCCVYTGEAWSGFHRPRGGSGQGLASGRRSRHAAVINPRAAQSPKSISRSHGSGLPYPNRVTSASGQVRKMLHIFVAASGSSAYCWRGLGQSPVLFAGWPGVWQAHPARAIRNRCAGCPCGAACLQPPRGQFITPRPAPGRRQ